MLESRFPVDVAGASDFVSPPVAAVFEAEPGGPQASARTLAAARRRRSVCVTALLSFSPHRARRRKTLSGRPKGREGRRQRGGSPDAACKLRGNLDLGYHVGP